ncbi:ABC transporter family substrate-binding protein [Nocardia sp. NPDC004722]
MRIGQTLFRLAIPIAAAGLVAAGCSSDTGNTTGSGELGTTNDINPHPVSDLKDGGTLRLPLTSFPESFNYLQVDGTTGDTASVIAPLLGSPFVSNAANELSIDKNYFTDVQLTGTSPQVVTYTINPKAVWTDGSPITWEDLRSEFQAQNGSDSAYQVSSTDGYDRVDRVERGVDDRQAIVTYKQPYSEWKGMFSPLYPKAATESPQALDNWARSALPLSAGPFVITNIDRTQNRITLGRNAKWWGDTPKLDTITFSVLDYNAMLPAVQNNELDVASASGLEAVTTAKNSPGVEVRRAPAPGYSFIAFNGAPGSIVEDARLRRALAKAVDRQKIVENFLQGVVDNPKAVGNHVYGIGQHGYQDNSGPLAFNLDQAAKELDELGWVRNGDVREKDGRKLVIRDVMYQQNSWVDDAKIIQADFQKIGVKLDIQTVPGQGLFTNVIDPGNYDLAQWSIGGTSFPLGILKQLFYYNPGNWLGNKSKIGSPELNAVIDQTVAELDPAKAVELANQADAMIWDEVWSLPFNQPAGTVAVRKTLANYGAFGFADKDYTKIGFLK